MSPSLCVRGVASWRVYKGKETEVGLRITRTSRSGPSLLVASSPETRADPAFEPRVAQIAAQLANRGIVIEHISLNALLQMKPAKGGAQTPVLVMLGEHDPDPIINRLMDMLEEHLIPALILTPQAHAQLALSLRSSGLMCEPMETDPAQVALILWTLAQRQPAIQQLATELSLTELTIRSVNNEMTKLHEELQSAASIQREYLPRSLPQIDGIDIGIVYRPASYVSGDIYDIVELDEHHTGLFLADAVGHGVPAALMTMVITQGLHKTEGKGENRRIVAPAEALRKLNNTMTEHAGDQSRFATAVYAIHDKRTNEITIAGAGHPPSLLVRAGAGEVEQVESEGPLLGVFPDVEFVQVTRTLGPGDVFIIYSDGFEVAFPAANAEGDDRKRPTMTYIKELSDAGSGLGTLAEAIATLEEHLDSQAGSLHQPDDVTALFLSSAGALSGAKP